MRHWCNHWPAWRIILKVGYDRNHYLYLQILSELNTVRCKARRTTETYILPKLSALEILQHHTPVIKKYSRNTKNLNNLRLFPLGFRGLYTGIGAQIVRDVPFYASFFGSYDVFCKILKKSTDWNDTSIYFVAGG